MRVFLTGGTGYLGGEVARRLRERGDEVRALVRAPHQAHRLRELGCQLVEGDLSDEAALVAACRGMTAVVHGAFLHRPGAPAACRAEMVDVNVRGTERVLGAALTAGVGRAVHVSSVAVFGDTAGRVADESWPRAVDGWPSVDAETASCAHRRAREIGACGLPLVTVKVGAVYGPGAGGAVGDLVTRFLDGRLPVLAFPDHGVTPVHRDDAADGVLRALDAGVAGESYVLAGEPLRVHELLEVLAEVSGRRAPRMTLPTSLLRALAPAGPLLGPALGLSPDLRELVRACDGVTSWACGDKARTALGWGSRPLREGLQQVVDAHQRPDRVLSPVS